MYAAGSHAVYRAVTGSSSSSTGTMSITTGAWQHQHEIDQRRGCTMLHEPQAKQETNPSTEPSGRTM